MVIEKKIIPEYFKAIKKGEKKLELRLADFKVQKGDILILKEWNPKKKKYTGRKIRRKVKYIFKYRIGDFWSSKKIKKYGIYIIQI